MNVIRVAIINRKNEIEIMRLVGASNTYIKFPYIIESIILSVISSLIALALLLSTYKYLFKFFENIFISNMKILTVQQVALPTTIVTLLVGIVISTLASVITIRRFIKI